ncbi:hypothetical protein [Ruminococcus albus]|uniref:hypothetical protein n=1 Tax=Ruminococcus albus TaxID=1264 RepID=UPI0004654964|nr:hypothetical protein [Ruminococcus albus]
MAYKSARKIGEMIGLSSQKTNVKLKELGYLDGEPGNYNLTTKGEQVGKMVYDDNGYGGKCARGWGYAVWDESVAYEIGDPDGYNRKLEEICKEIGLEEPFDFSEDD